MTTRCSGYRNTHQHHPAQPSQKLSSVMKHVFVGAELGQTVALGSPVFFFFSWTPLKTDGRLIKWQVESGAADFAAEPNPPHPPLSSKEAGDPLVRSKWPGLLTSSGLPSLSEPEPAVELPHGI